ncbi:MAG: type 2 isopentenyl-diphosphate Delta-isomerase [Bdellovibrionota bacterium]
MDIMQFEGRKREHIKHALDPANQATGLSGLDRIRLVHEALPDFDFDETSLESICLGHACVTPFYIAGMTAGCSDAPRINMVIARACLERGWAMGVGSQRRDLEEAVSSGDWLKQWRDFRDQVPQLTIFANIGLTQLVDVDEKRLFKLVDALSAQALVIHVNSLQEALQPEGTPYFHGAFETLSRICRGMSGFGVPVVLKETGCGFSLRTLQRVAELNLAAVDISGLGGTHWGRIEGARSQAGSLRSRAALTFADWGEPTVDSVLAAKTALSGKRTEIWASGGVRSGLDVAKLIALGSNCAGYAKPALEAALSGQDQLREWMELQEFELKLALFCSGHRTPTDLRSSKENVWTRKGI